jgi:hypothetical protein
MVAVAIVVVYLVYTGATSVISSLSGEPRSAPVASTVPPAAPARPVTAPRPAEPAPQSKSAPQVAPSASDGLRPLSRVAASDRALRRDLMSGLTDSRSRLESCPDSAGEEISGVEDGERFVVKRPPVLVLEVATRNGAVEILDVRKMQGRTTEAFLACARDVLRGKVVSAGSAKAGSHIRIPVNLGALQ